jgi:DHA2 family multidrug resistance protein
LPRNRLAARRLTTEAELAPAKARHQATIALMIATAMQAFDATIANVALPQLERGFGGGIDLGSWVMTSYLCASAVTAILTAWLRRRWGARPVFTAAVGVFVAGSLLCALATRFETLIAFRLIQGAAGGVIQPLAQAIILDLYPKHQHGRMLAVLGATIMAGPMLGPVLGGLITDVASWRWIFGLNAPLGAIALVGLRALAFGREDGNGERADLWGIAMLVIATGSLQFALQRSIGRIWPPAAETTVALAATALAAASLALRTARGGSALLRFDVYRNINFTIASLYNFLVGATLFTTIVFVPALAEGPMTWSATEAGLVIAPRGLGTMAMMIAVRHLIDRIDHRVLLAVGLVVTAAALALMARVPPHEGQVWLAATSAAQGIGVGLLFTPLSTMAFSNLDTELRTDGSGVYNLGRQLGCATGVAAMTAVLQARIGARLSDLYPEPLLRAATAPTRPAIAFAAYTDCFWLLAIITLAMIPGVVLFRVAGRGRIWFGRGALDPRPPP